jgi:MFS family permease
MFWSLLEFFRAALQRLSGLVSRASAICEKQNKLLTMVAVGLALLADTVDPSEIGQVMGYVGIALSLGMLVAPLLGGIAFDRGGYNAVFAMCYGLVGLDIIMRLVLIEKKEAARWLAAEPPQTDPEAAAAPAPSKPSEEPSEKKTPEIEPVVSQQLAAIPEDEAPPLQRILSKRRYKLPPIVFLLSSRRLLAALWASLVQASLLSCFDSVVPLHVKTIFGWSSTGAGLVFLPIMVPTLASPLVGWVSDTYGPRWPATAGFVVAAPLYVCLRFVDHDGLRQKVLLCALLALIGLSMTLCLPPLMAEITYVIVEKERRHPGLFGPGGAYAQAYGLFNMAFAGGCVVGPIWAGFVNKNAGWGTMGWSLGLFSFVTALPTVLWVGGSIFKERSNRRLSAVASPEQNASSS